MSESTRYESWEHAGIDLNELVRNKGTCPQCSQYRKKKKLRCLHVYPEQMAWHCFHCGWHGYIPNPKYREMQIEKKYTLPQFDPLPLSQRTIDWFSSRGIEERVLRYFKVSEVREWMYGATTAIDGKEIEIKAGETTCIAFPYRDDSTVVNVKYRATGKRFKMAKDAKLILYNLNAIKNSDTAIICEGEIDAMTFYQCDCYHVVSVPNGANKFATNQNLEYLDNCIDHFENKKKIYIATDGDEAGQVLRDELVRRLGKDRCYIVEYPEGCKDANEVFLRHGTDAVRSLITSANLMPLEGIFEAKDIEDNVLTIYRSGYPKGDAIGMDGFDELLTFRPGELTTVTGIPSSGKSNFVDQIMIKLAARHGWKFGIFSPEQQPTEFHVANLCQKYVGESIDGRDRMNELKLKKAVEFVNNHFFFMKLDEMDLTIDGILGKAKELVARKGINGLLIDPYNYIEHKIPPGYSETQYVSELLTKIKNFKQVYQVHTFLIAHPTKIPRDKQTGKYEVPTLYHIAGSAHFYNKTDNGFTVYRDFETNLVTVYVQKVRFRWIGKIGHANFIYHVPTGRYKYTPFDDPKLIEPNLIHFDTEMKTEPKQTNWLDADRGEPDLFEPPKPEPGGVVRGLDVFNRDLKTNLDDWN